jgi:hypothetical protein
MKFSRISFALLVLVIMPASASVQSKSLPTDGTWQYFDWDKAGVIATYTFVVEVNGQTPLQIVDAFQGGDTFKVDINDGNGNTMTLYSSPVPLNTTAPASIGGIPHPPPYYPANVEGDPDAAWKLDAYFSQLSVWLGAGSYTVTISLQQSAVDADTGVALDNGIAFIRAGSFAATSLTMVTSQVMSPKAKAVSNIPPRPWGANGPQSMTTRGH